MSDDCAIPDYRTGEVLASGHGNANDLEAAWRDDWCHVDAIRDAVPLP
jgi:hypothetical protein